uniref:Anaphase-promoting complex subunit 15-like protein n=1 Tax=Acartia pacifica TaxID=335913 RepID=A0A0U2TJM9_ACAPC|nr:anaphase-promoting complex subunit 15-like protein [Acartia pacifica]
MSWSTNSLMKPALLPRVSDPLWFGADRPVDEEAQIAKEENDHADLMIRISQRGKDIIPIGKSSSEALQEPEEEEDEDEDSESDHEDEDEEDIDLDAQDNNQN